MGDIWDDSFNWENPAPVDPGTPSYSAPAATETAAASPGIKAQSGVLPWASDWFKGAFNDKNTNWWTGAQNAQDMFKNYFSGGQKYGQQTDQMMGQLPGVWDAFKNLPNLIETQRQRMIDPSLIETQRQNMVNQLYASLPKMRELYQPAMEDMSRRGILNSSITGDALGQIQDKVNQGLLGQTAAANTWAGGQNVDQAQAANKWAADQNVNSTTNMSSVLAPIIATLMSGNKANQEFGVAGANIGNTQQNLINDFIKAMTQGSTTFNV